MDPNHAFQTIYLSFSLRKASWYPIQYTPLPRPRVEAVTGCLFVNLWLIVENSVCCFGDRGVETSATEQCGVWMRLVPKSKQGQLTSAGLPCRSTSFPSSRLRGLGGAWMAGQRSPWNRSGELLMACVCTDTDVSSYIGTEYPSLLLYVTLSRSRLLPHPDHTVRVPLERP